MSEVAFVKTQDRAEGVKRSIQALGLNPAKGKDVLIKPNFNTADTAPGSTHNDTLIALVDELWNMGARSIAIGERSYPPTAEVMRKKGVIPLLQKAGVKVINFDDLEDKDWIKIDQADGHWPDGFRIARPILEAECLVSTGCVKTHQYGGVFTLSLKLHVGIVPTDRHGYPYMAQLHSSRYQREMIAEINAPFSPDLIVLDGVDVFVDGGPMTGKRARGDAFLASADRVAIDAAAVALLKVLGSNNAIMNRKIFEQDQIARAVELGIGASSPSEIQLLAADKESETYKSQVADSLMKG